MLLFGCVSDKTLNTDILQSLVDEIAACITTLVNTVGSLSVARKQTKIQVGELTAVDPIARPRPFETLPLTGLNCAV